MLKKRLIKAIVCLLIPALVVDPLSGTAFAAGFQLAGIPIVIPSHYGTLTDSWTAAPSPRHPTITPPCVVIIQDLHANPSVQRNIAEIVKSLARSLDSRKSSRENRFLTVFVEGAQGPFDVSILRHVAIGKVKKLAVQKFLDEAKVTGAEIAAIEAKEPIHLWGVDEKDLYLQNLQDFYQASRKSPSPIPGNTIWSRYYSTARQRDIPLTLNSLAHLDLLNKTAASSRLAVVVAGGYHTEGITHLLKANHVSYAVVTPVVGELGHERVYAARLRSLAENAHKQALVVALGLAVVG